jgi:hypothetical protein
MLMNTDYSRINHHRFHISIFDQCIENHLLSPPLSDQRLKRLWTLPHLPYSSGKQHHLPPFLPIQTTPSTNFLLSGTECPTHPFSPRKTLKIRFY